MTANRLQQISAVVSAVVVDFEINFTDLWRPSETYHRTDVSAWKGEEALYGDRIVFSDERKSRNGFCVTTYLRCDTSTVEISYDETDDLESPRFSFTTAIGDGILPQPESGIIPRAARLKDIRTVPIENPVINHGTVYNVADPTIIRSCGNAACTDRISTYVGAFYPDRGNANL
ncbi:hypothetical protein ALC57_00732 [Trachymyrmex cornetzi]|uniref:Uncharacterized protein n=1 Tax=Trachymyrmex cornetzi TaxID=471704 RepID=A0A151JRM6_9HYME|nr:hypothetical protein ALC57_00732 [Trachymyrmex cornetzi]